MPKKPVEFTLHAMDVMKEREVAREWLEQAVTSPDWVEPDLGWEKVERRFKIIAENGNRVQRVVCLETDSNVPTISVFFDRKAKRPT
jgi:hypothetical protein